ncbi:homoserine dehydrogenase [Lactobacillus paragasseri]|uniref:Homoserine dehydrogenase n=1 Tax=Lactobacillus paragasseri TaxID=2107999 RepID=A0ABD4ZYR4_9LACO|nr:homoserine dehydrogenase [Lactobacillus paragasseri]MDK7952015.1 homoserine dehydrogenase [Lactobacillus paragasseri]MDO6360670.1 homoserine dehydrogenase [Lactobacillus paragasseri]MDX5059314.1 homoserine dehydrogenase [Lactobacillus paragasseri]
MKTIEVAMLGLGTVGSGVIDILKHSKEKIRQITNTEFKTSKILVRNIDKYRSLYPDLNLTTNFEQISQDQDIKVVIEVMGGLHPAKEYVSELLKQGRTVITANKDLVASFGPELMAIANEHQGRLFYEASVAGGIPILRILNQNYVGDQIKQISGIVNGTSNYILTQMADNNWSYEQALSEAQKLGFAEADPTNDVSGKDAAYKLIILGRLAFGINLKLDQIKMMGITEIDQEELAIIKKFGYTLKLIAKLETQNSTYYPVVMPMLVSENSMLGQTKNEFNGIEIESYAIGKSFYYGPGAGKLPTANSVINDLVAVAKKEAPFKTDWNSVSVSVKDIFTRQYWFKVDSSQNKVVANLMDKYQIEDADFLNDEQYDYYLTDNITVDQKAKLFNALKEKNIKVYSMYEVY